MTSKNFWKRLGAVVGVVATVIASGAVVAIVGNDFRFTESSVTIPTPAGGSLSGVVTHPQQTEHRGIVVMVHGDGPVNATQDGLYDSWFEAAADAGFATVSWSKPGIDGSSGDWLTQSMPDRANEVSAVIDWAIRQPDLNTERIMLWGASQAGWVLPQIMADRTDIDGVVVVGTAINWLDQGRFNLLAELDAAGATPEQRDAAVAASDEDRALLEAGASAADYAARTADDEPMTPERWGFVLRNFRSDAVDDLTRAAPRRVPVLLLSGDHDRNVDVDETARVYREILGHDAVTVQQFTAVHSLARPWVENSELTGIAVGVFWPRGLLASGVTETYRQFLQQR